MYDDAEQSDQSSENKPGRRRKKRKHYPIREDGIVAFDLGIKTLATSVNDQERFYHIGGFKGYRWYNKQLDKLRSKRDRCKKKSRRYIHLSKAYKRVSERKRNKQRDCLHKASHFIAHRLAERAVVISAIFPRSRWSSKSKRTRPPKKGASDRYATAWCIMIGALRLCADARIQVSALWENTLYNRRARYDEDVSCL